MDFTVISWIFVDEITLKATYLLSRHRGAKQRRRYGRSGAISLFNLFLD